MMLDFFWAERKKYQILIHEYENHVDVYLGSLQFYLPCPNRLQYDLM